ncbi:PIN domain-like protein [Mycena vitilis]|nr:PIN domain-like protein [Mycena vitilis]
MIAPAAQTRSILHLSTVEGFQANNRGLRTLLVGDDVSIRIEAIVAALKTANVFYPGPGGQKLVLEKLFYQLCNLSLAPITLVFVPDGDGRPSVKRGTKVVNHPSILTEYLKPMITAFGFYFYDARTKAEAELAQLNALGKIDAVITEDSDAFLFGARCVIRTSGPSVQHDSLIYTIESIENTESVSLDKNGLILCALLLGGDYAPGISGVGPIAALGFGRDLAHILQSFQSAELTRQLATWRNALREELRTNSSRRLDKRQPTLASNIPDTFPDLQTAYLYLDPFTSSSATFTGSLPDNSFWRPREPDVFGIAQLCSTYFGWTGEVLLKKLTSNLWPGATFKLLSSVNNLLKPSMSANKFPAFRPL